MKVSKLTEALGLKAVTLPEPEREINGVYVGDLLSFVMSRAHEDNIWITIMSNINVIAVATLVNTSCIILAENVMPDSDVISTASEKGINILATDRTAYEIAVAVSNLV